MPIHRAVGLAALTIATTAIGLTPSLHAKASGTIVGVVTTTESVRPAVRVSVDSDVCGATVPDESVVVDGGGHLANAVVTVTGVKASAPAETVVANEKCRFMPHVALVRPAGIVKVSNKDPSVLHTTHAAMMDSQVLFNVGLPPTIVLSKSVDKAGVAKLVCSTHTWMRGWLVVTDELSAVSGADGGFRLDGVPSGTQEIRAWHEELRSAPQRVTVKSGETVTVNFTFAK